MEGFLTLLIGRDVEVKDGIIQNETWEGLLNERFKSRKEQMSDLNKMEVQQVQRMYAAAEKTPDLDLDDIIVQVVEQRDEREKQEREKRIQKIQALLPSIPSNIVINVASEQDAITTMTPLQFAASMDDVALLEVLLSYDMDNAEETFFIACREGFVGIIQFFVKKALFTTLTTFGYALSICARVNCTQGVEIIYEHIGKDLFCLCQGSKFTPEELRIRYYENAAQQAIKQGHVPVVQWFLARNLLTEEEWTNCMQNAIMFKQVNVMIDMLRAKPFLFRVFRSKTPDILKTQVLFDYYHTH